MHIVFADSLFDNKFRALTCSTLCVVHTVIFLAYYALRARLEFIFFGFYKFINPKIIIHFLILNLNSLISRKNH